MLQRASHHLHPPEVQSSHPTHPEEDPDSRLSGNPLSEASSPALFPYGNPDQRSDLYALMLIRTLPAPPLYSFSTGLSALPYSPAPESHRPL